MKEIISTDKAPAAIGPYSQGVKAGGFLFLSGQIALDPQTMSVVPGDAAALVQSAGCGVSAEAENPRSIAAAAIRLAETPADERQAMGARSRDYYWKHLSLSVGVGHFAECFRRLALPGGRG